MSTERFDLIIIGAGIHGVGVAQAAAATGHSALVLEQTALAAGTSSRSSKLIHGGLRYLESGQFSLVRECLRERALLLRLAPELVRLTPFYIPIYPHTHRRPWQLYAGLSLYALLGGLGAAARFDTVPRPRWSQLDGLDTSGLQQVFRYNDAQTDDAALTRAVMHSATQLGAELRMPATFLDAVVNGDAVSVRYRYQNREYSASARVVINAAGPWVNHVASLITPAPPPVPVDLVQGTHLVLPGTMSRGVYYLEAPQEPAVAARHRRAVFVMPWQGLTLLGTTETVYHGDPGAVTPLPEEQDYLLTTLRHYFPQHSTEVTAAFAGLRVLPRSRGAAFARSRETILQTDRAARPRVLSIYGGKLTAYRATAAAVLTRVAASLPDRAPVADTRRLPLTPA